MTDPILLMPVAGAGSRFAHLGEPHPKPLIPVAGRPMVHYALGSITRLWPAAPIVFVALREHEQRFGIAEHLRAQAPGADVVFAEALTGGSLETCLHAAPVLQSMPDRRLIVMDCDLAFRSTAFHRAVDDMAANTSDGVLLSFRSRDPRYSYAALDAGRVVGTVEKQPVSDHALAGAYAFASTARFLAAAQSIVATDARVANGEYYLSSVYNALIGAGAAITITDTEQYWSFGTPDELASCLARPDVDQLTGRATSA